MKGVFKTVLKLVAWSLVLLVSWLILESIPRWGLELAFVAVTLKALSLWAQRDAWAKRYLVKLGYEDWSNARLEVAAIFLEDK